MPPTTPLNVRVVVKLPYNRPEDGLSNPAKIVWNQEKADILWKVIERSRSADSAGADWKGLAEHLEVPLPYLLYRVNARFQEDIRGLRDIKGALSPTSTQEPSLLAGQSQANTTAASNASRVGGSGRTGTTPLSVRQRLNSLGNHALASARRKPMAASNATFQAVQAPTSAPATATTSTSYHHHHHPHHPLASSSSPTHSDNDNDDGDGDGTDSDGSDALREEEAERQAEEEETLARKLAELQRMMTADTVGLVSNPRLRSGVDRDRGKGRQHQYQNQQHHSQHQNQHLQDSRGRLTPVSPHSLSSSRMDALSSRSQSISSAGSPQGSIPDIPSQSSGSQPHSPVGRDYVGYAVREHAGRDTSARMPQPSSPPTRSSLAARSNSHGNRVKRGLGEFSSLSNQGSSASSFSDLSDASISASALESAFGSNFGGSRLSQFNRSRRTHSVVPQ